MWPDSPQCVGIDLIFGLTFGRVTVLVQCEASCVVFNLQSVNPTDTESAAIWLPGRVRLGDKPKVETRNKDPRAREAGRLLCDFSSAAGNSFECLCSPSGA